MKNNYLVRFSEIFKQHLMGKSLEMTEAFGGLDQRLAFHSDFIKIIAMFLLKISEIHMSQLEIKI